LADFEEKSAGRRGFGIKFAYLAAKQISRFGLLTYLWHYSSPGPRAGEE
jgi:hypothetical protein